MRKQRTTYNIRVTYPLHDNFFQTDQKLRKAVGHSVGSGAGFGIRDMVWVRVRKYAAENVVKKLRSLRIRGMKVMIEEQHQEWNARTKCWQYIS